MTSFEDLPPRILVCSSFVIEAERDKTIKTEGFNISTNTDTSAAISSEPEIISTPGPVTLSCPFPNCQEEVAVSYVEIAAQFSLQETLQLFSVATVAALASR